MLGFLAWHLLYIFLARLCDRTIFTFLELTRQLYTKCLGGSPGNLLIWIAQLTVVLVYIARDLRRDKCLLLFLGLVARNWHNIYSNGPAISGFGGILNGTVSPSGYTNWMSLFVVLDTLAPAVISVARDSKFFCALGVFDRVEDSC